MSGQWGDFKSCKALLDRVERNDPSLTSLNILPMKTFGDVELNRLAKIISSGINNHLLTFHASGHVVSYDCLEQFGFALSHASENNQLVLTDIAFGDKNMSDEGIASFAKGLRSSGSIVGFSKIDLSSKSLSAISWNLFIQSIYSLGDHSSMSSLRYLNMADNDLSGLKSSTKNDAKHQVESLNLARCNLKADDAQELLSFLLASQSSSIELIMSDNTLIGPSIRVLASAICKEKGKIRTLKLDGCGICDEQLEGLLYLGIGPQLQCVDLSRNRFETSSGISALASALSTSSVNDVVLSRNTIFEDSAKLLASALSAETCCVKYLDLAETNLCSENAREFLKITTLEYLRLFNNDLGGGDFFSNPETAKLVANSNLKTLDLCGNHAINLHVFLATLLEIYRQKDSSKMLEVLELGGNKLTEMDETLIDQLKSLGVDVAKDRPTTDQEV